MIENIRKFLKIEAFSGIVLVITALIALILANSPLSDFYFNLINEPLFKKSFISDTSIHSDTLILNFFNIIVYHFAALSQKSLNFWINEGLMVLFFFIIGLEVKKEFLKGELSDYSKRILPIAATLGGIIFPALIYLSLNYNNSVNIRGWAIPTATDIAFALGILTLFGKNIPTGLRIFLLTIAVLDDLSAVLIIALFYVGELSIIYLFFAFIIFGLLLLINKFNIYKIWPYVILSFLLWYFVLRSGIHPTIAGVLAGFTIPLIKPTNSKLSSKTSPLEKIEQNLHPYVAFLILPLFAFANAGVSFDGIELNMLLNPLPLGIILGLFLGKQFGIFVCSYIPVKMKWAKLPSKVNWFHIYGISILCGIGFTMSLFMGSLAFENEILDYQKFIKIGVLIGTLCSAVYGYYILKRTLRTKFAIYLK